MHAMIAMTAAQKQGGFWAFSTALYETAGVKDACLALQDRFGADVNLALFCVWTVADGGLWTRSLQVSADHQARIQPIRTRRRALDPHDPARTGVLVEELAAEKEEQAALETLVPARAVPTDMEARAQLIRYARALGANDIEFLETAAPLLQS